MYTLHRHSYTERGGPRTRYRSREVTARFDAFFQADESAREIQARGLPAWVVKTHGVRIIWHYQMDGTVRRNGVRV